MCAKLRQFFYDFFSCDRLDCRFNRGNCFFDNVTWARVGTVSEKNQCLLDMVSCSQVPVSQGCSFFYASDFCFIGDWNNLALHNTVGRAFSFQYGIG